MTAGSSIVAISSIDNGTRQLIQSRHSGRREIAKPFGVTLMLEFTRTSRFAGCLPTALKLVRDANHDGQVTADEIVVIVGEGIHCPDCGGVIPAGRYGLLQVLL